MKQNLLILTALMCGAFAVKAQQADYAKATVRYKFSHLRDTTQKDKPYTENMILFLGSTSSAYKSYDKKMQEALMRKQMADQIAEQKGSGGPMRINISSRVATTSTEWYMFPLQNKMARKERLITPYLIEEPIPAIKWKISSDTASFGTLHCQKATGHLKGRDYTAWFCPDLPFHVGPWKLNGLPGLIVEAYDTNKEVVFKFDGMEEVVKSDKPATTAATPDGPGGGPAIKMFGMEDANTDPNIIELPTDAVKTTEKEFNNLREAMRKDPQAFMQSAMAGSGMNMRPAGGAGGGPVTSMRVNSTGGPVNNNPLELPEKK